jgi:signal transduction histidine kinase
MLQTQHDPFVRDVTDVTARARPATTPTYVEVLEGVARDLMPAVWALGVQCSVLRLPADLTARERQFVDAVDRNVQRLARVLASVHDLVLAETEEGLSLDERPSQLASICEDAIAQLREAGLDHEIACEGEGDGEGVWDPERLVQAISYLIECAAEAAPEEPAVRVSWRGGPREIVLVVERAASGRDAGSGIDLEWGTAVGARPEHGVKAAVARRIVLGHGGTLARLATARAVAYVAVLPRRTPGELDS